MLTGVADRAATTRSSATGETPQEYLYNSIHNPTDYLVPGYGALMPQLGIPECQVWDMVAYLATQSETGEPPFEVTLPDQCVVSGPPPGAEATAEVTAEATGEATAEATSDATAEATTENPVGEDAIEQIGGEAITSPVAPTAEATTEATEEPTAIAATVAP